MVDIQSLTGAKNKINTKNQSIGSLIGLCLHALYWIKSKSRLKQTSIKKDYSVSNILAHRTLWRTILQKPWVLTIINFQ